MSIYSKLSFRDGGGIVLPEQQADQTKNAATLLIGLGGTGIDCIRRIKTQVYDCLKPDDENADVPAYEHIRFLGVDSDVQSYSRELKNEQNGSAVLPLSENEFFSVAETEYDKRLLDSRIVSKIEETSWFNEEAIPRSQIGINGTGGIRQVGRLLLMNRSEDFINRLGQEIRAAKCGLDNPEVNIHIFTGLGGGLGSGCFLDVCYMARSIERKLGNFCLFGYFFMPDIGLSKIPAEAEPVRENIVVNGYAAMKELNYCMELPGNGGSFEQVYQGNRTVRWAARPVDMCLMISAKEGTADIYNQSLAEVADYVMNLLIDVDKYGTSYRLANYSQTIWLTRDARNIAANSDYGAIGTSSVKINLKEINTWLLSRLFKEFYPVIDKKPKRADVEELANSLLDLWGSVSSDLSDRIYDGLKRKIGFKFSSYPEDWKYVRDYGNERLVRHYQDQVADRAEKLKQFENYTGFEYSVVSLLEKLNKKLEHVSRDLNRGPCFAYRMLSPGNSKNILSMLDFQINNNQKRWEEASNGLVSLEKEYKKSKEEFENKQGHLSLESEKTRFSAYEECLRKFEEKKLEIAVIITVDRILETFRQRICTDVLPLYAKLSNTVESILQISYGNYLTLNRGKDPSDLKLEDTPEVTIDDLRIITENDLSNLKLGGLFEEFISLLNENKEAVKNEDMDKIYKLLTVYFRDTAFSKYSSYTLVDYLKLKYEKLLSLDLTNHNKLNEVISEKVLYPLSKKKDVLFDFNPAISKETIPAIRSLLCDSEPQLLEEELKLSEEMNNISAYRITAKDRIVIENILCGFPLCAYNNSIEYGLQYYSSKHAGVHSYEGKPLDGMAFTDWNKLPPLDPMSLIDISKAPAELAEQLSECRALFEKAKHFGVIDSDDCICIPSEESLKSIENIISAFKAKIENAESPRDIERLQKDIPVIRVPEDYGLIRYAELYSNIQLLGEKPKNKPQKNKPDYALDCLMYAPVIQAKAAEAVKTIETVNSRFKELPSKIEKKGLELQREKYNDFFDALFTGVITVDGKNMILVPDPATSANRTMLYMSGEDYKYTYLPIYQAFVSFEMLAKVVRNTAGTAARSRIDEDDPVIDSVCRKLLEIFTEEEFDEWALLAKSSEQKVFISDFINELKSRFQRFCLENGLLSTEEKKNE